MQKRFVVAPIMLVGALFGGGCANDGSLLGSSLTTSSVSPEASQASKIDPACVQLTAKIDAIRKDGVVERVEKASTGKSKSVSVYRESLAKMAELDRANAEFQAKCSTLPTVASASVAPASGTAQAPAKPAAPAMAAQKTAAAAPAPAAIKPKP